MPMPLVWRSSVAVSALRQLLTDTEWGPLDVLVIDAPPGTGDVQLTLAQDVALSAAVVVTTPQPLATDDVRRALRMLQEVGRGRLRKAVGHPVILPQRLVIRRAARVETALHLARRRCSMPGRERTW